MVSPIGTGVSAPAPRLVSPVQESEWTMAGLTMSVVEGGGHKKRLTAEEVKAFEEASGQPVGETLEEALADAPGTRLQTEHGTQEKAEDWLHAARSYAQNRDPKIIFAGNSIKSGAARWDVKPKPDANATA